MPAPTRAFTIARLLTVSGLFALALGAGATIAGGQETQSGGSPAPQTSAPLTASAGGTPAPEADGAVGAQGHASQTTPETTTTTPTETVPTTAPTTPTETVPTTAPTTPTETLLPELPTEGTGTAPGAGPTATGGNMLAATGLSIGAVAGAGLILCAAGAALRRHTSRQR